MRLGLIQNMLRFFKKLSRRLKIAVLMFFIRQRVFKRLPASIQNRIGTVLMLEVFSDLADWLSVAPGAEGIQLRVDPPDGSETIGLKLEVTGVAVVPTRPRRRRLPRGESSSP